LDPGGMKLQGTERDGTLGTFVIHTALNVFFLVIIGLSRRTMCVGMWRERLEGYTGLDGET